MSFGTISAGSTKNIQPTESSAGYFRATGVAGTRLRLTFTLPSTLMAGGSSLAMSFGATDAAWSGTNNPGAAVRFDPRQPLTVTVPLSGVVHVWLGGRVSPPTTQGTGTHTGSVTLSVVQVLF